LRAEKRQARAPERIGRDDAWASVSACWRNRDRSRSCDDCASSANLGEPEHEARAGQALLDLAAFEQLDELGLGVVRVGLRAVAAVVDVDPCSAAD
jgi:hypothetical protein